MSEEIEFLQQIERRLIGDLVLIRRQIERISPPGAQSENPTLEQFAYLMGTYDSARDKRKAIETVRGEVPGWDELWKQCHRAETEAYRAINLFVEQLAPSGVDADGEGARE
jgi:hypothetical protein